MSPSFLPLVVLMSTVPYLAIRRNRLSYLIVDLTSYGLFAGIWLVLPGLGIHPAPSLAFALFAVAKLATFFTFIYLIEPAALTARWAGVFAGVLYLTLIPHVLQWPIDGDEPYYLLVTESLVQDRDLDLRNQYEAIGESKTRRPDLKAQMGDPTGPNGQQYSRTEPFLSLLLIPGYLMFGLAGAVGTIAVFGGLLVWSAMRLLETEAFAERTRVLSCAFLAAGPPVIFYATRLWPEVPAAFFLVESLRALRRGRTVPFAVSIAALALLKLRFLLIAAVLLVAYMRRGRVRWQAAAMALAVAIVPLTIVFLVTGEVLNVHEFWELRPTAPWKYARGFLGLLLDAQTGILFQAPFFVLGVAGLLWWRELSPVARAGLVSSIIYLLLLFPREEWHGGWSPPLRYLVVLIPVLCVVAAFLLDRIPRVILVALAIATAAVVTHGLAFPWRLFHEATGESVFGEVLSSRFHSDFSRMLPSFIRPNIAAWVAAAVLVLAVAAFRARSGIRAGAPLVPALGAILIAIWFRVGLTPGCIVHFEDAHVQRSGGELYPPVFTVARFLYSGGWTIRPGDSLRFQYDGGESRLRYVAHAPAGLLIDGKVVNVPRTVNGFGSVELVLGRGREHIIQGLAGEVILDQIETR